MRVGSVGGAATLGVIMSDSGGREQQSVADRRRATRAAIHGDVTVRFDDLEIVGPGENISETGVYFIAEARARVRVLMDGEVRDAEIVRIESLGNGHLGVAVRFVAE